MKPLGAMITGIMTKTLKKKGLASAALLSLVTRWDEIVGEEFAEQTKPFKLAHAILTIEAHAGAALELQHQSDGIILKINTLLEYEAVKRIKFIQ